MTVTQLIKRAQQLERKGYGNSEVMWLEHWIPEYQEHPKGGPAIYPKLCLNTGYSYREETFFGTKFNRRDKTYVFLDTE